MSHYIEQSINSKLETIKQEILRLKKFINQTATTQISKKKIDRFNKAISNIEYQESFYSLLIKLKGILLRIKKI